MSEMTVRLIGSDESIHAEGKLSNKLLETISIIERNSRLYRFTKFHKNVAEFYECVQPYILTEF